MLFSVIRDRSVFIETYYLVVDTTLLHFSIYPIPETYMCIWFDMRNILWKIFYAFATPLNTYLPLSLHIKQNKIDGYCLEAKIDRFLYNCFILGKLDHQSARLRFLRDSETIIFLRKLWRNNYKINEKHATSSISYILLRIRSIQLIIPYKIRNWLKYIQLIFRFKEFDIFHHIEM